VLSEKGGLIIIFWSGLTLIVLYSTPDLKRLFGERCARSGLWWPKSSNIDAEGGPGNVLPTLTNSNRAQDGDQ
jgi:hypothetical protein